MPIRLQEMAHYYVSKWANLHLGPMWSSASVEQDCSSEQTKTCSTVKVSS